MLVGLWPAAPWAAIPSGGRPPGPPRARSRACTDRFPGFTGTAIELSLQLIVLVGLWPAAPWAAIPSGGRPPGRPRARCGACTDRFRASPVPLLSYRCSSSCLSAFGRLRRGPRFLPGGGPHEPGPAPARTLPRHSPAPLLRRHNPGPGPARTDFGLHRPGSSFVMGSGGRSWPHGPWRTGAREWLRVGLGAWGAGFAESRFLESWGPVLR